LPNYLRDPPQRIPHGYPKPGRPAARHAQKRVIRCQEYIGSAAFGAGNMQRIHWAEAKRRKFLGACHLAGGDADSLVRERQKLLDPCAPVTQWTLSELDLDRLTSDPSQIGALNPRQDENDCLSLQPDPVLCLIVEWAVEAADVEVDGVHSAIRGHP
jgi:hypothetical protein